MRHPAPTTGSPAAPELRRAQPGSGGIGGAQATQSPSTGRAPGIDDLRLVYVVGMGHSGSTLLDLLLSSHDAVVSVGEVKRIHGGHATCSCDAGTVWRCPFWAAVGEAFERRIGVPLRSARIESLDPAEFLAHNRALLEAVSEVSGRRVIVDSSKSAVRLERLLRTPPAALFPVHIVRRAPGVAWSNARKGRGWARAAFGHGRRLALASRILAGRPHRLVRYEHLATRPDEVIRELTEALGLEFDPAQLRWAGRVRHNCGGNRMRRSADDTIRLDEGWRRGFAPWQRAAISLLDLAGRRLPLRPRAERPGRVPLSS